jgi:hypothetical protein
VITSFVDFLISGAILIALMLWYQFLPGWRILTLPFFIAITFAAAMGAGLWLTTLNVKYRDFRYIVPFIVQFGLYISPVGFNSSIVPDEWRLVYSLILGGGDRWFPLGYSGREFAAFTSSPCFSRGLACPPTNTRRPIIRKIWLSSLRRGSPDLASSKVVANGQSSHLPVCPQPISSLEGPLWGGLSPRGCLPGGRS